MSEIEQKCLSLPREERERLANVLIKSLNFNVTGKTLDEIQNVVSRVIGFEFIMPGRTLYLSVGRTIFTHFACLEGYSESKIGDYLHKDHSTVHHMKDKMKMWLDVPHFYSTEYKWYEQVRKELYETDR
jgi:hypothetical protein